MENYERNNRIAEALNMRGMKQIELAEKTGISRGTINNWLKNKYQPKRVPLMKMAQVLDVAELWLAGYDVPIERAPEQKKADALIELFNQIRSDAVFKDLILKISSDVELKELALKFSSDIDFKELVLKIRSLSPDKYQTISNLVNQLAD